jgi:transposase
VWNRENEAVLGRRENISILERPKPKEDRWLKLHPQVHLHFTPTYSSWLNQVECWFSILSKQALSGASFTSPQQLREAIDKFVAVYNKTAAPFEWTKAVVHPTAPKPKYADLCK